MAYEISFIQRKKIKKDKTILEIAQKAALPVKAPCDGKGKCGKCLVRIIEGNLPEPTKAEKKLLGEKKLLEGYRLACETVISSNVKIELL